MKKYIIYKAIFASVFLLLFSCDRDEVINPNIQGNNYILTTQSDVDDFDTKDDILTLTITGEGITDISSLSFVAVKNLIIENTGIVNLDLPNLQSVTVSLQLIGNTKLEAIDGVSELKFFGGNFLIEDNDTLSDISGILGLKVFNGTLIITGNAILGENVVPLPSDDFGFGPISVLINDGVLSSSDVILADNHPNAVTDASLIGVGEDVTIIDYTLTSKADVLAFENLDPDGIVNNLTLRGEDIDNAAAQSLVEKITEIQGTLTIDNTSITTTENFINKIDCQGGFSITNNESLTNPNGFKGYTEIGGDLIIEDNSNFVFYSSDALTNITRINGTLRIISQYTMQPFLKSLKYVEGDFDVEGGGTNSTFLLWDFNGMALDSIGGDLILKNNQYLSNFNGLHNLKKIGGDVTITGNSTAIKAFADDNNATSWILFKNYKESGVISSSAVLTLYRWDGTEVDLDAIQ